MRALAVFGGALLAVIVGWFGAGLDPGRVTVAASYDELQQVRLELGETQAERDALGVELDQSREVVARLTAELAESQAARVMREREWLAFTRALAELPGPEPAHLPAQPSFLPNPPKEREPVADFAQLVAEEQAAERAARARRDLNALLVAEQVLALDVLQLGQVNDGWAGPIVVRLLDERGRMIGTLAADRLRLEASRSGRTVTLVFEQGWESHAGVRIPFGPPEQADGERGGSRRVHLPGIDPEPWIELLPELLRPQDLVSTPDDGRWNLIELRLAMGERLRFDSPGGRWRLVGVGGVVGGDMLDVHLAELGANNRVQRRLFADTLRVRKRGAGLELELHDGVIERDGAKAPFLDGRYRLYLPKADPQVWKQAGVPGLSPPPARR